MNRLRLLVTCLPAWALLATGVAREAGAAQLLRTLAWETAPAGARTERSPDGVTRLVVDSPAGGITLPLLTVDEPGITTTRYALVGEVSCEGVGGTGFLEMWSLFADGGRYFSRSLAEQGPLASLRGTAGPRRFVLPFFLAE